MNDVSREIEKIVNWIKERLAAAGAQGAVFGLSGGIDSAVVAALCRKALGHRTLGVIMPCHSHAEDVAHAQLVARALDLPHCIVDLGPSFDTLVETANRHLPPTAPIPAGGPVNLKPRLRMATLYYYAAYYNYLVMGTGNKSEIAIGYFTKYGDGGVDLEPIGHLYKEEVKAMAVGLGIPAEIITKPPSAGLWEGQSDEQELGFTYHELDQYLKCGVADNLLKNKIDSLRENSEHKRRMPPIPNGNTD